MGPSWGRTKVKDSYSRAGLTPALAQATLRLRELRGLVLTILPHWGTEQVKGSQGSLPCGWTVGNWGVWVKLRMKSTGSFER